MSRFLAVWARSKLSGNKIALEVFTYKNVLTALRGDTKVGEEERSRDEKRLMCKVPQ